MIRGALVAVTAVAALAPAAGTASAADADLDRSCSRPLGLTEECLENTVCGAPSRVARAAGLDEYGLDPTVNCVE